MKHFTCSSWWSFSYLLRSQQFPVCSEYFHGRKTIAFTGRAWEFYPQKSWKPRLLTHDWTNCWTNDCSEIASWLKRISSESMLVICFFMVKKNGPWANTLSYQLTLSVCLINPSFCFWCWTSDQLWTWTTNLRTYSHSTLSNLLVPKFHPF